PSSSSRCRAGVRCSEQVKHLLAPQLLEGGDALEAAVHPGPHLTVRGRQRLRRALRGHYIPMSLSRSSTTASSSTRTPSSIIASASPVSQPAATGAPRSGSPALPPATADRYAAASNRHGLAPNREM